MADASAHRHPDVKEENAVHVGPAISIHSWCPLSGGIRGHLSRQTTQYEVARNFASSSKRARAKRTNRVDDFAMACLNTSRTWFGVLSPLREAAICSSASACIFANDS